MRDPGHRISEVRRADGDRHRSGDHERERLGPRLDPSHPDHRDRRPRRRRDAPARARGPDGRPREPAATPSQPRLEVPGSTAEASSVLISETASAPPAWAAAATVRRRRHVRRELHDQRLGGQRPHSLEELLCLVGLLADDQTRLHVRTRDVQLQPGHLGPIGNAFHEPREFARGSSPSLRRSAAREAGRARAGPARESPRGPCSEGRSS